LSLTFDAIKLPKNSTIKLAKLQNIHARHRLIPTQHSALTFFANKHVSPLVAEFGDPGLS